MSLKKISIHSNLRIKKHKGLSLLNVLEDIDRNGNRQKKSLNRISINSTMKLRCLKKYPSLFSSESDSALIKATAKFKKGTLDPIISSEQLSIRDCEEECLSNNLEKDNSFRKCKTSCSIENIKENCCKDESKDNMFLYEKFNKEIDQNETIILPDNFSLDSNNQNSLFIQETSLPPNTSKICEEMDEVPQKDTVVLDAPTQLKEDNNSGVNENNITYGKEDKETYINLKCGNPIQSKEAYSQFDGVPSVVCIKEHANIVTRRVKKRELHNKGIQAHRQSHHYLSPYHSPPYRFLFRPFTDPIYQRPSFPSEPIPNISNSSATKSSQFSSAESPLFPSNSVQILFSENTHKQPKNKHKKKMVEFNADRCKLSTDVKQNNNIFQKLCCIATKTHGMFYSPRNTQKVANNNKTKVTKSKENEGKRLNVQNQFKYASTSMEASNIDNVNEQFTSTISKINQDNTVYYQQFVPNCNEIKNDKHKSNYKRQNFGEVSFDTTGSDNIHCCSPCEDSHHFNYERANYYAYSTVEDNCSLYKKNFIKPTNKHTISNSTYYLNSHLPPLQQNYYIRKKKLQKIANFEVYNTGPYGANIFNEEKATIQRTKFSKKNTIDELIKLNESAKVTSGKKLSEFPDLYEHVKKLSNVLDPTILS